MGEGGLICLQQELSKDVELKAMVCSTRKFLHWPKNSVGEPNLLSAKKVGQKPSQLAVKLNHKILGHFVGWSHYYKKIGHVDFLAYALLTLSEFWEVPWISLWSSVMCFQTMFAFCPSRFCKHYVLKNG